MASSRTLKRRQQRHYKREIRAKWARMTPEARAAIPRAIESVLKENYGPTLVEMINQPSPLHDMLRK